MVRIGSVTAEILLIWTNVARTNVAWKKCDCDNWHLLRRVPGTLGTYLESLVKIGPVTAEILLIWTNVARTNVAWTNVVMTGGISSRWSQESTFKVWSKSDQ